MLDTYLLPIFTKATLTLVLAIYFVFIVGILLPVLVLVALAYSLRLVYRLYKRVKGAISNKL